jgi:hypothetical protein
MAGRRERINKRIQLWCVWAGPLAVVLYLVCFWGIAHFVPPPSPHWSALHVATFFGQHHTRIRIGQLGGLIASTLFFPFFAVISAQMWRVERGQPVLAMIQFGGAVLLLVFFVVCSVLWIGASFRSDLSPQTVRMLNDLSWLTFVMVFPAYVLQMVCIAIVAFTEPGPDPVWPRWAGYFNLWTGITGMGGGLAVFFKHGPFAWNGLIGFYIPIAMFVVWICVTTYLLHAGIRRQLLTVELEVPIVEREPSFAQA